MSNRNKIKPSPSAENPEILRINISLPRAVHELGKRLARLNHRKFSGQLAALIEAEYSRSNPQA